MGNIHCCILPSPRGRPANKNEPYGGLAEPGDTLELPHISDREGKLSINCQNVVEWCSYKPNFSLFLRATTGYHSTLSVLALTTLDIFNSVFFAYSFYKDLSDHRGTLFSQKSNSGRFIEGFNEMSFAYNTRRT